MNGKKFLITGATGFVGSNLSKKLIELGSSVSIVSKKEFGYENINSIKDKIEIFEYDGEIENLINYMKKNKFDAVFHLASLFIAEHQNSDVDNLIDSNIKFGTHLLEAMKESETKLLIDTGTSWQHYNNEEYNPVDLYAATKQAFQDIIKYYTEAEGLRCITLKLFDTYGENDKRPKLINLLNKFADEGTELNMSPGEQVLDLVHIDDVIEAFVTAFQNLNKDKKIKNQLFSVATNKTVNLKEVISIFENVSGKKIKINWGGKSYRKREVMTLWSNYEILPNWIPKISLEEGLKRYKVENKDEDNE
ncbi:MAG: NAD-dependent epimerase/dehydratase family protein [Fusobacteriaceae bacterium]